MLDEKKLLESKKRFKQYLDDGLITTKNKSEFVDFFILNADNSLNSANLLYDLSINKEMQSKTGYLNFNGFLWVVNASYYSMFYIARALLENEGIKIKSELSIHLLTFDAIINFFYINKKLEKKFIDDFEESMGEMVELLGKQKADLLIEDYFFEKGKRASFTYKTDEIVIKSKAKTSLERARRFVLELKKIIK